MILTEENSNEQLLELLGSVFRGVAEVGFTETGRSLSLKLALGSEVFTYDGQSPPTAESIYEFYFTQVQATVQARSKEALESKAHE